MGIKEIMNTYENKAIEQLGKRSYTVALLTAIFFAMFGAGLILYNDGKGLWAMWIPLCFFVIPTIHHLAKKVMSLEERISKLEKK